MRKQPLHTFTLSAFWTATALIAPYLILPAPAAQQTRRMPVSRVYRSPDRTLISTIISSKQPDIYGADPSRLEIRNSQEHLLVSRDHSSYPNQGYVIGKAAWTADSRFFVYLVAEAGGHSPWHHPIFFYSRKRHRFYSLDAALAAFRNGPGAITGDMELRPPCTLLTKGRYYGKNRKGLRTSTEPEDGSGEQVLQINLRWLESHLTRSAVSSDESDEKDETMESG